MNSFGFQLIAKISWPYHPIRTGCNLPCIKLNYAGSDSLAQPADQNHSGQNLLPGHCGLKNHWPAQAMKKGRDFPGL
jgi:hypothetical protein